MDTQTRLQVLLPRLAEQYPHPTEQQIEIHKKLRPRPKAAGKAQAEAYARARARGASLAEIARAEQLVRDLTRPPTPTREGAPAPAPPKKDLRDRVLQRIYNEILNFFGFKIIKRHEAKVAEGRKGEDLAKQVNWGKILFGF